jgi:hypothetical protein
MKKIILSLFFCFALTGNLTLLGQALQVPEQYKTPEQIEQTKQAPLTKNLEHKLRIGFNFGFAIPYEGTVNFASYSGSSSLLYLEYNLNPKSYVFSEILFCGYSAETTYIEYRYPDFPWTNYTEMEYEGVNPLRSYSYILGLGQRSKTNYSKMAWQYGIGLSYNYNVQDELTAVEQQDTLTIPASSKYSIGIDIMFGYDLPLVKDQFGVFSNVNINTGIIGTKMGFQMQYISATILGMYFRI